MKVQIGSLTLEEHGDEIEFSRPSRIQEFERDVQLALRELQHLRDGQEYFNAAINFAIDEVDTYEGVTFLRLWREGCWSEIKEEFPEFKGPFPK